MQGLIRWDASRTWRLLGVTSTLLLALAAGRAQSSNDPANPANPVGISRVPYTPNLILWDQCGYEGAPPCGIVNPIFGGLHQTEEYFSFFTTSGGCDLTLTPVNGICTDVGRRSTPASIPNVNAPSWLLAQQADQYNRISADLPLNMVPMFGTHNSYSNLHDGSANTLSIDQDLTITDQLNLGARFIRLDPISNATGTNLMVCHMSPFSNFGDGNNNYAANLTQFLEFLAPNQGSDYQDSPHLCGADPFGRGVESYQRPFYLALEEIQHWLKQHPGEVVVIDVNNFFTYSDKQTGPIAGYVSQADLEFTLQHVFSDTLLLQSTYINSFPNGASMPTVRQVRSLGKQVLVLLNNFEFTPVISPSNSYGDGFAWAMNALNNKHTSDTTSANFSSCYDSQGYLVINRDSVHRVDLGEDRTVSNALTTDPIGLVSWTDTAIAAACGYSTVSFDFLYSLSAAPNSQYFTLGLINYTTGGYFFAPGPGGDERPRWLIWSWPHDLPISSTPQPAALVHLTNLNLLDSTAQQVLSNFPATSRWMTYRWLQMDPNTALPFACAGPPSSAGSFPDPINWWGYQWEITQGTGNWNQGETQCQKEFGPAYHFWRPMSGAENFRLTLAMDNGGPGQIWLNHFPGATQALPGNLTLTYGSPGSQTSADIVMTSGFGGAFTSTFSASTGSPANFVTASVTQSNMIHVAVNQAVVNANPRTSYQGELTISESHPDGSAATTSTVGIVLNSANNAFTASPAVVDFKSGNTQTISLGASPQNISFLYDQKQTPSWLAVSFNQQTTPAQLTLTVNPVAAPLLAFYSLKLTPTDSHYPVLNIPISFSTIKVTLATNPPNVPISVDGVQTQPGTLTWVAGSTHLFTAPQQYVPVQPQTLYQFQGWALGILPLIPSAVFQVTAPQQSLTYTAQFGSYYGLAISQTVGGTVNLSPQPDASGFYPANTSVTISAAPSAGYVFKQFTGDVPSQQDPSTVVMDGPKSVGVSFAQRQVPITFATQPPGLSIVVDGQTYQAPATFQWANPEVHSVTGPTQAAVQPGYRYVFSKWNDTTTTNPRSFSNFTTPVGYTLIFGQQAQVSAAVAPLLAGTVTGDGWYGVNTPATLQASPAAGFNFNSFLTGSTTSTQNPLQFTVTGPVQVTANFAAAKSPVLYASAGPRADLGNGTVQVPIILNDLGGAGPAGDATVVSVTIGGVPTGAGTPTIVGFPAGGIDVGTIFPGGAGQTTLTVNWPDSATRATFTVQYQANGGASHGSNSITIYR